MSVKIRLRRMGKKKQPHYRIVVADSRAPRDGRFVENLGYYNPVPNPARLVVDLTRVDYWLGEGAIASPTVGNLVSKARSGGDDTVALDEAAGAAAPGSRATAVAEDNGAEAAPVAEDSAKAAPVAEDNGAEAAPVAEDDSAKAAPVAEDDGADAAPVAEDDSAKAAPVAEDDGADAPTE